ncbi:MAG: peptide ABC transporter substrate-binding protein [Dehalococcoidia bacterium]|nr:peptide ABC transporter substrate-binding protein [Dehalococcoidia bacterium]
MASLLRGRLLYLTALIAGAAALAAGWYLLAEPADPTPPQRYVEGVTGQPERISPLFAALNEVDADLASLVFDGLTRIDGAGVPRPNLAERWDITADGLTYTFHLRRNVFWHDGEPFDAADVAFTVAQVQAPGFRGDRALAAQWSGVVVTVIDSHTVAVRLPAPSASLLTRAALGLVPEHLAGRPETSRLRPIGTGAFRAVEVTERHALLRRHPGYHAGVPALHEIELRFHANRPALAAALGAGEVDAALLERPSTAAETLAVAARPDLATSELAQGGFTVLYLNNQRDPLNDIRLRQAIAAAIDVPSLNAAATTAGAGGLPGDGPILPASWAYVAGEWPPPGRAAELFDAAGWLLGGDGARQRGGVPLLLALATNAAPVREAFATEIADRLGAFGVAVEVTTMPSAELVSRHLEPRDYGMAIFGWETEIDPDPYGAWHTSQILPPGRNVAGYNDALADSLLEAARTTLDEFERRDLYVRFTERFVETVPSVVLQYPARTYAHPAALRGLTGGILFEPSDRFRDVHLWRLDGIE